MHRALRAFGVGRCGSRRAGTRTRDWAETPGTQLPGKDWEQGAQGAGGGVWEADTGETLKAQEGKGIRGAQPQAHLRGATGLPRCHRKGIQQGENIPTLCRLSGEKATTQGTPFPAESFAGLLHVSGCDTRGQ